MLTFNWNDWREVSDNQATEEVAVGGGVSNAPFTVAIIEITDVVKHLGDVDKFLIETADGSLQVDTAQLVRSDRLNNFYLFVVSKRLGGKYVVDALNQVGARNLTTRAMARNLVALGQ